LYFFVGEGADHDDLHVPRQDASGVADRLAPPQLNIAAREEEGMPTELQRSDLEGDAGASRALREDHRQGLALQRGLAVSTCLHARRNVEDRFELVAAEVGNGQEIAL